MKKELGTFSGKTVEEALQAALSELKMSEEQVGYEVLEKGKVTFLGIGSVKAKISVYTEIPDEPTSSTTEEVKAVTEAKKEAKKEVQIDAEGKTDGERAVEFLKELLKLLGSDATPTLVKEGEKIEIDLATSDSQEVIGKRGVKLDALQNLAGAVANIGREEYKRVMVDCNGYREKRDETLARVAQKTAEKAVRLGKKISLEPMSAYERRIIHATLANSTEVKTTSEGKEPRRRVVIIPNELKHYDRKPGNRGDRDRFDRSDRGDRGDRPFRRDRNFGDRDRSERSDRDRSERSGRSDRGDRGNREFRRDTQKPRYNYTEAEKEERSRVSGGTSAASSDKSSSYKKSSSVVFGTYLGNSRKNDENKD
jgi:spoIIIJ-associated protein